MRASPKTARRFWRIRTLGVDCYIVRRVDLLKDELPLSASLLRFQIAAWVHDPLLWPTLIDLCQEALGIELPNPTLMGTRWLQERLDDAFQHGRLVVTQGDLSGSSSGGGGGAGASDQAGPQDSRADQTGKAAGKSSDSDDAPPQSPKTSVKTWFRARLLDEDGQPMAGEDYILIDTDGAKRQGKLDDNGEVYIPAVLPPGNCTISFPNIHLNPLKRT